MVTKGSIPQMPDLAVEIKPPDDTYPAVRETAAYYLKNGSRLVWLVFPEKHSIEAWRHGPDQTLESTTLGLSDSLSGEEVVPGFSLDLTIIFKA
jgi:Uma2 family endonuclease